MFESAKSEAGKYDILLSAVVVGKKLSAQFEQNMQKMFGFPFDAISSFKPQNR